MQLLHKAIDLLSLSEINIYFDNHSFRKNMSICWHFFYIIRFTNKIILHGARSENLTCTLKALTHWRISEWTGIALNMIEPEQFVINIFITSWHKCSRFKKVYWRKCFWCNKIFLAETEKLKTLKTKFKHFLKTFQGIFSFLKTFQGWA